MRPQAVLAGRVNGLRRELAVPLYRNAYALMLNTAVNSGFGLLYWIVAARTYSADDVGRGSALVSLMMLISTLTQLNLGQALIRFLPRAGRDAATLIRSARLLACGLSTVAAAAVMAWCHLVLVPGDPLYVSWPFAVWFVVSTAAWSLFNLQDSTLIALRAAPWVALKNGVYGLVKLIVLVVVAATAVTDGVFTSWTAPVLGLLVPVALLISRRLLPRHAAAAEPGAALPDRATLTRYVAGDYTGSVFNQATSTFLPVLVVTLLGPAAAAYLLPAQTVFLAMNLLSTGITSSLVVEGSRDEAGAHRHAVAILKRICLIVLPAAALIGIGAPLLLWLYGPDYRDNATLLLQLLMVSMLPRVVVTLYMTMSRLQNRTGRLAAIQAVHAVVVLGGTVTFAGVLGLDAIGWSWLAAEIVLAVALVVPLTRWLRGGHPPATRRAATVNRA